MTGLTVEIQLEVTTAPVGMGLTVMDSTAMVIVINYCCTVYINIKHDGCRWPYHCLCREC